MKKRIALATGLALAAIGFIWTGGKANGQPPTDAARGGRDSISIRDAFTGLQISPVPMNIGTHDPILVGYGSYLVNSVAGCNDCHTNGLYVDGGNPFMGQSPIYNTAGFLGGGQAFGPFISRNLTPEDNGMPAGMTFQQFQDAMQKGVDHDMAHPQFGPLLQVMPWPSFSHMDTIQVRAIYEYLSTIPSVKIAGVNAVQSPRRKQ